MSSEAIARLLTSFDTDAHGRPRESVVPFERRLSAVAAAQAEEAAAKAEEAYGRGKAEAQAAALAEHENKLAEEKVRYAIRLGAERERWTNEQAALIANGIAEARSELENTLADTLARVLAPLVTAAVRERAVAAFLEHLSVLLTETGRPVLRISGPADLLEAIRKRIDAPAIAVEYRAAEAAEVRVVADQTVIETQIQAWIARIRAAIG